MVAKPSRSSRACQHLARAADDAHRLVAQEGFGFRHADHGKAARLVQLAGQLGEEFVAGKADRKR